MPDVSLLPSLLGGHLIDSLQRQCGRRQPTIVFVVLWDVLDSRSIPRWRSLHSCSIPTPVGIPDVSQVDGPWEAVLKIGLFFNVSSEFQQRSCAIRCVSDISVVMSINVKSVVQ